MFLSIFLPFITVLVAELFDKSQLSLILLATKTKHRIQLLLGALLAFLIVDGLAILLGSFLTTVVSPDVLQYGTSGLFILFGILSLLPSKEEEITEPKSAKNVFFSTLGLIFLAEMGDKTQIVTGVFATEFNPVFVLIGTMLAFTILSVLAILIGQVAAKRMNTSLLKKVSGILFIGLGILFLFS